MMWVAIIDSIIGKYGYNVSHMDFELFRQEMENNGLFRKTLVSLMRKFKYIDVEHQDTLDNPKDVKEAIQRIFRTAFADCIIEVDYGSMETPEGQYLQASQSSNVDLSTAKLAVGEINQFEVRGFVRRNLEGVTVIDERKS
jgi:phage baseplate assembly protein W